MKKETKKITLLKSKIEVEYYTFLTAGENREWLKVMSQEDKKSIDLILESQDYIFSTLIKSVDNSEVDILSRLLDLDKQDFKQLDTLLSDITKDKDFLETEKN